VTGVVSYHPRDWERIQRTGVIASVTSPEEYATRVLAGMRLAEQTLARTKEIIPTFDTIKGIHYIAFERVHPWGGTFRQPGQEVRAGDLVCSLAEDVTKDLLSLRKEMLDNPLKGSKRYMAEVLGFYHASFLAIHPFLDGNGRIGRMILDFQTKRLLGHGLSRELPREEYIGALVRAQQDGDLRGLAKIISKSGIDRGKRREVSSDSLITPKKSPPKSGRDGHDIEGRRAKSLSHSSARTR
jgi:fido (protein-threonine AMPylation protein)